MKKKSHDSMAIACAKLSFDGLMVTIGCVQLLLLSAATTFAKVLTKLLIIDVVFVVTGLMRRHLISTTLG